MIFYYLDLESNLDRPWVNLGMVSEEYEDEKIGNIPSISPDSKNDFSNIHEDVSSFPKLMSRKTFGKLETSS